VEGNYKERTGIVKPQAVENALLKKRLRTLAETGRITPEI
jgi:hypothetical protein